jgi:hypothetical protein
VTEEIANELRRLCHKTEIPASLEDFLEEH